MTDKPNPFLEMLHHTMRTIRDETVRKTRERQFKERMSPEEFKRVDETLDKFVEAIDPLCGDEPSEEDE